MSDMSIADNVRANAKRAFLNAAGWADATVTVLAGDASNRRYDRIVGRLGNAVLMDAPAERGENIGIFLAFTNLLRDQGYSAPKILEADLAAGFALIEDLGDDLYARVASSSPALEPEIYSAAVDLLVELHKKRPPETISFGGVSLPIEPYDISVLQREALLLPEWWIKSATGISPSADLVAEYETLISSVCGSVGAQRSALVLRDYHAENLLWLPDRSGTARVGLLDYQDALAGSPAYDLASLLEDARRETSAALREAMINRYLAGTGQKRDQFASDYATLAAQRNLKIVGIFARLAIRDGKPDYLSLIPRVWNHLMRDLDHPDLQPLSAFVKQWTPAPTTEVLARVGALAAR